MPRRGTCPRPELHVPIDAPAQHTRMHDCGKRTSTRDRGESASGANRDRTGDLLLAKQALSQLSYGPKLDRV